MILTKKKLYEFKLDGHIQIIDSIYFHTHNTT